MATRTLPRHYHAPDHDGGTGCYCDTDGCVVDTDGSTTCGTIGCPGCGADAVHVHGDGGPDPKAQCQACGTRWRP